MRSVAVKRYHVGTEKRLFNNLRIKEYSFGVAQCGEVAEEVPDAYKDVNLVAGATEQADLARRVAFLKPKICIKVND